MNYFVFCKNFKFFIYYIVQKLEKRILFFKKKLLYSFLIQILLITELIQMIKYTKVHLNLFKKLIIKKEKKQFYSILNNDLNSIRINNLNVFLKDLQFFSNFEKIILPISIRKKINKHIQLIQVKNKEEILKNINIKNSKRSAMKKKFDYLFNYNLPEYQQYQGYFDTTGRRIKKFTLSWDEAKWIYFLFNYKKKEYSDNHDIIFNYLENLFMILIYIQTGKTFNFFFFQSQKIPKPRFLDDSIQLCLFYKIFILDRKWNVQFSQRQKAISIFKHLNYTSDLSMDNLLILKRNFFNLTIYDTNIDSIINQKLLNFFITNTYNQMSLIDFINFNKLVWIARKPKKFCLFMNNNLITINQNICGLEITISKLNYDLRLWHTYCTDSYLFYFKNKIEIGIFFALIKKTKNFSFDFLLSNFYKKLIRIKKKKTDRLYVQLKKFPKPSNKIFHNLIENWCKFKMTKNKKLNVNSFICFSKKKFVNEIKVFFKKLFKYNFSLFLVNGLYYLSSNWSFHSLEKILIFEVNININENLISKFYNLFILHGSNPFLPKKNSSPNKSNCVCFLEIHNKKISIFDDLIRICLSIGKNINANEVKKFQISLLKRNLIKVVLFFCAKYRSNLIIIETNSFLDRSISVFFKMQLSKQSGFENQHMVHSLLEKKSFFFKYIRVLTLEKNSIIFNLANSTIIQEMYPNYSHRILFLVLKIFQENIVIYFFFLLLKKMNLFLKINHNILILKAIVYLKFFYLYFILYLQRLKSI
nr:CPARA 3gp364 [Cryptomonas curvata]